MQHASVCLQRGVNDANNKMNDHVEYTMHADDISVTFMESSQVKMTGGLDK